MTYRKLWFFVVFMACFFVSGAQMKMVKTDEGILIREDGDNVLFYQMTPKNEDGKYERNNYIHPLWGIYGKELTEDFPADHLHHRGVFWAWHQVWIGDKRIGDPWEIKDFEQKIIDFEFLKHTTGEVVLQTEVDWLSPLWRKAGEKVPYIKEFGKIVIHPQKVNYRRIDFEIRLEAQEQNLRIGGSEDEKGYSGFSVRLALPEDVSFSGVNGEVVPEVTAVRSPGYINVSGKVDTNGTKGGIVIVDNPENPGYPQSWILRAKNSMQNAAWPGKNAVEIPMDDPLVLKYSLIVYSGKLSAKKIINIMKEGVE